MAAVHVVNTVSRMSAFLHMTYQFCTWHISFAHDTSVWHQTDHLYVFEHEMFLLSCSLSTDSGGNSKNKLFSRIGRHSKSLDTEKKVCGHCRGRFQLLVSGSRNTSSASLPATPRTPNPFAQFVKENYGSVKKQGGGLPHKQVMDMLSKQFAKTKINFDWGKP